MLFNSFAFALFFPVVYLLYWGAKGRYDRARMPLLLIASYVFYGWWDWRFLGLIAASTAVDFFVGSRLGQSKHASKRRFLLGVSVVFNLGMLGYFKYANFFLDSLSHSLSFLGWGFSTRGLEVVLPVGISFYTFQTMSYTFDVYRRKMEPTRNWVQFATYVAFFPQLVAGPIERASYLLPQFTKERAFNARESADALRQILYGLFKKVVIADYSARIAAPIFAGYTEADSLTLIYGAVLFSFQIYGDFSGYSDIAIGTARLLGFDLRQNFATPYFSRDLNEFWRRWHISLSTWFRDYLYIPLGGNRRGTLRTLLNVLVVFAVSGLWHGARWNFVIWGVLNGALVVLPMILQQHRKYLDKGAEQELGLKAIVQMMLTFAATTVLWIFFRSPSVADALGYMEGFSRWGGIHPVLEWKQTFVLLALFLAVEWQGRDRLYAFSSIAELKSRSLRYLIYTCTTVAVFWYSERTIEFIYFQF